MPAGVLAPSSSTVPGSVNAYLFLVTPGITSAASVSVAGRVSTADGAGMRGAFVTLIDANGVSIRTMTNAFGYYSFAGVQSGAAYVATVESRRFRFAARLLSVTDALTDLDFVPQP